MEIRKAKEIFYKSVRDCSKNIELVYNWDSSIPEFYKKSNKERLRHKSSQPQKITSVDYMTFSNKVLEEYSKYNNSLSSKRQFRRGSLKKDTFSMTTPNNHEQTFYTPIVKFQVFNNQNQNSSHYFNNNQEKNNDFKSFSFEFPKKNKEKFLIHKYSIPNGLAKIKSSSYYRSTLMPIPIMNPNIKHERKGLLGGKFSKIKKKSKKLILSRIA